ncbi:MAG: DUF3822 family protein [Muribaculaceae bacterium]|nr:DUF3822 family protein [Muribaculaceae bacterium]
MYQLTAADFADTGQWRLILNIGLSGLQAELNNTIHPELPPQPLCNVSWQPDKEKLRENIEEAIYNNPRLLDDFATTITIFDPLTLFIPTDIAEEKNSAEEDLYKKVFPSLDEDIMNDRDNDITAVWSLAPGVKSLLLRSFPGARITCNLMQLVKRLRKSNARLSLFLNNRGNEIDLILLDANRLISASTHPVSNQENIDEMVERLLSAYAVSKERVNIEYLY